MIRALCGLLALLLAGLAHGHPLGNNTVNRQAVIEVARERVSIRYLLDLAEIPTLLATQEADADADGSTTASEWDAYARRRGDEIRAGIELLAEGGPLALILGATRWQRLPGAAGLDSLRIEARFSAPLEGLATAHIEYRDHRRPDEAGWKEVVAAAGRGARLTHADVPRVSPSGDLAAYPAPGANVLDVLSARIETELAPVVASTAVSRPAKASPASQRVSTLTVPPRTSASPATLVQPFPAADAAPDAAPHPSMFSRVGAFFRLGVHHIATGWDHLVFLLGLIVAQKSPRRLAWVITAFTVAHSLTLGLAASGLVTPPGNWVEPAIALTIAYVGLANLMDRLRHGVAIAFAFGLVHGFGFAGALAASLRGTRIGDSGWLFDLAAFNLGIEAFQLALILTLLPLMALLARLSWSGLAHQAASVGVLGAGLGWFFTRI